MAQMETVLGGNVRDATSLVIGCLFTRSPIRQIAENHYTTSLSIEVSTISARIREIGESEAGVRFHDRRRGSEFGGSQGIAPPQKAR